MKLKNNLLLLLFSLAFLPSITMLAQPPSDQEMIEEKPRNLPSSDRDHRNKKDFSGRKWGVWKTYSIDKLLIFEVEYYNGQRHGKYARYNGVSGKPMEVVNYFYGVKDGAFQKYYGTGDLRMEGEYDNGKRKGTWTYYFQGTGTIKMVGEYVSGQKEGEWKYYDKKENLVKTEVFKNGQNMSAPAPKKEDKKDDKTKTK